MRDVVAQGHQCATLNAIGHGFDSHWWKLNISYFHFLVGVTKQNVALSSASNQIKN